MRGLFKFCWLGLFFLLRKAGSENQRFSDSSKRRVFEDLHLFPSAPKYYYVVKNFILVMRFFEKGLGILGEDKV